MSLDKSALELMHKILSSNSNDRQKLEHTLRILAKWRSQVIGATLVVRDGTIVRSGPFAGLVYLESPSEGGVAPKLLGAYEAALHDFFGSAPDQGYDLVLNIGCAEGYYAVGCARLLPASRILAWDIDPRAREMCASLARLNGVEARVELRERFEAAGLNSVQAEYAAKLGRSPKGLMVMDCEGAEFELLDPAAADFRWVDLVVEVHPGQGRSIDMLVSRFEATHTVEIRQAQTVMPDLPDWLNKLGHLDQLIAVWEWRAVPTPWLILRAR